MRISDADRNKIHDVLSLIYGPDARIYLFGSRTDDAKKGGDIDLLAVTDSSRCDGNVRIRALTALQTAIGLQKIDLIVTSDPEHDTRAVVHEALRNGIAL